MQCISWVRPSEVNHRVGGVSNSRHIVGDAIDFYGDGITGDRLHWWILGSPEVWGGIVNFPTSAM